MHWASPALADGGGWPPAALSDCKLGGRPGLFPPGGSVIQQSSQGDRASDARGGVSGTLPGPQTP